MRVLVIGAAGRVGSAALGACLAKNHTVTAFVRNPQKLPPDLRTQSNLQVVKGDATTLESLTEAIRDQDAVIQAAVYGSNSPFGTSDSEKVIRNVVAAIKREQRSRQKGPPIRLWVLSGQVLMDIPGAGGRIEGDVIPIHPEHYQNYAFLQQDAADINWSVLCPGRIEHGEPMGPIVETIDEVGLWQQPWIVGRLPLVGPLLNVMYNWKQQKLTYQSVGDYLASNLGPKEALKGKRVGILEHPGGFAEKEQVPEET